MFGKKSKKAEKAEGAKKVSVLFVDETNDLQSQIAEYFLTELYGDVYEVRSAGPKHDFVDCELISVMYQNGYDMRRSTSKDFSANTMIKFDYIVFMQQETYDRVHGIMPFGGKHILRDFGSRKDFKATDDHELAQCYSALTESVKEWITGTFSSPEDLEKLVIR
jgi:protein-tyrosine-phosphatase